MILQKLASAIRRQDWFQVVIEVLIVIVGIFLGLQVQAWYESQAVRAEEQVYLERLIGDLEASIERNNFNIRFNERQWEAVSFMSEAIETCTLADDSHARFQFYMGAFNLGKRSLPVLTQNTINELNATGKFQYIQNVELRDAITNHIDEIARSKRLYETINARLEPNIGMVEKYFTWIVPEPQKLNEDFDPNVIPDHALITPFEDLCGNEEIIGAISRIVPYHLTDLERQLVVRNQQYELIDMINIELERFE